MIPVHRTLITMLIVIYLLVLAYFAFRPFRWLPSPASYSMSAVSDGMAVHVLPGLALEVDRRDTVRMRSVLMKSGRLSLEVMIRPDAVSQSGPARIVTFSRDKLYRNFTLAQEGNALSVRLRTTETDPNALLSTLVVPGIFESTNQMQHLVVTYDGARLQLFQEGKLRAESNGLRGDFANWGRNHALLIGDEPNGGLAWSGSVERLAIFDRALTAEEVSELQRGNAVPGVVLSRDFHRSENSTAGMPAGIRRLKFRNLFISTDPSAYSLSDCIFNVTGFVPLGILVYMLLPLGIEGRKVLAVIILPIIVGLLFSVFIEWMQRSIPGRVPCALDLAYNMTGTLLGSLLAWLAFSTFALSRPTGSEEHQPME